MESSYPPFEERYKELFKKFKDSNNGENSNEIIVEECELPLIDLSKLELGEKDRELCKKEIAEASKEWGFFQVINHGITRDILERMRSEQIKIFNKSFSEKVDEEKLNFPTGSYCWGTPSATCLKQVAWLEAFHFPLSDISTTGLITPRSLTMEEYGTVVSNLAHKLADILAEKMGHKSDFFKKNCLSSTCYLRMNRYPPCRIYSDTFGLMPHTDSSFLTILHQDQIGGLQLVKDGKWIAVKPNQEALIINIGDLFQAWSSDVYRSVEHRVVTNKHVERFSVAYFLCPSYDTVIQSCIEPSVYRKFSYREFKQQIKEDVRRFGNKVGLSRFLL